MLTCHAPGRAGKLKKTGAEQLSPRSKRLAELNKENEGGGDAAPPAKKAAPAPAAPPPPPAAAAPPPPPPSAAAAPAKQVNTVSSQRDCWLRFGAVRTGFPPMLTARALRRMQHGLREPRPS